MIYCLSLNPCLDKTASLPRFSPDAPNRIAVERVDLGGKALNVCRVLHALGASPTLVGFDYQGQPLASALKEGGIAHGLWPLEGELRVNMKLRELDTGRTIEINEQGPAVSARDLAMVENMLLCACQPGDWALLCGSLPPGAPADTYARLCAQLKSLGCQVAVDCDGPALQAALAAGPHLIKPNAQEFEALTGVSALETEKAIRACEGLLARGVGGVCLSRGPEGAIFAGPDGAYSCPAPQVPVQGVQGAGDSMLAGLILSFSQGAPIPQALQYASAAAGASIMRPGTLIAQRADVERLLQEMNPAVRCS